MLNSVSKSLLETLLSIKESSEYKLVCCAPHTNENANVRILARRTRADVLVRLNSQMGYDSRL